MCLQKEETVDNIITGCELLARTEYTSRHNNAASHLHWSINLANSTRKLIDMTVLSYRNITLKEMEKKSKYKDLKLEIQRMRHMKIIVIPAVLVHLVQ